MTRLQKISRLAKIAHDDPDRAMQHKVYDALVANGLSEEMAATVVSNIPIMDMRDLWKKLKPAPVEHEDPYGWRHSCGESFYQLDSPGDPCPSCGDSDGDWEYYDEDMVKESGVKKIASNRNYKLTKESFVGFKAPQNPATQPTWSWDEVMNMAKENKKKLYWVRDKGELWEYDGEAERGNVLHSRAVCTATNSNKCPEDKIKPPAGSYYETM